MVELDDDDEAGKEEGSSVVKTLFAADSHPNFPYLRVGKAPVFKCFDVLSDTLQEGGSRQGEFAAVFECKVVEADGRKCCRVRKIFHKANRGVSTTNLIEHVRERAKVCEVHKKLLRAACGRRVGIGGGRHARQKAAKKRWPPPHGPWRRRPAR